MTTTTEYRPAKSVRSPEVKGAITALAALWHDGLTVNQVLRVGLELNTPLGDFMEAIGEAADAGTATGG